MKKRKTEQEKETEGILRRIFKQFVDKKIEVKASYLNDAFGEKGNKRLILFYKEKDKND